MSFKPYFAYYPRCFRAKTASVLEADEIGIYHSLLNLTWERDGGLPNDMEWMLAALKSCIKNFHGRRFNRVVPKLLKLYFTLNESGLWVNGRLKELSPSDRRAAQVRS
jgi:uncharacterized protein YdaU (DUF1376 family)